MKKWIIVFVCIILVAVAGGVVFKIKINEMIKFFTEYKVKNVDLQSVADGTYRGSYGKFVVAVDLETNVQQHRIADIKIVNQKCGGKKYDGKKVIDRVLQAQSLNVDAITGSTASSKCILIALEKALTAQQAK
jgi:uncharacterized protein with FMN-binding domain